jgi:hypothetical protein
VLERHHLGAGVPGVGGVVTHHVRTEQRARRGRARLRPADGEAVEHAGRREKPLYRRPVRGELSGRPFANNPGRPE